MNDLNLLGAFMVGLLGAVHCLGMCGGIVSAMSLGMPAGRSKLSLLLGYNLGRLGSYALAGSLAGGLGVMLAGLLPVALAQKILLIIAALFMLLMGLYLGGWWNGLAFFERQGGRLWRLLEPFGRRLLPVRSPIQALALGLIWGWIPCGLVYSVLVWALSAGSATQGALLMLAFGAGTLPNLLLMGGAAGWLAAKIRQPAVRKIAGALILLYGLLMLAVIIL